MMDLKISIIIPAYNISKYIGNCLNSVIKQSWTNLEIIVVDDGSTDDTAKVAESYACEDCRIKVIRKRNGGVTSARMVGIGEATGDYIGFVDGDDTIESTMYERLVINAITYHADISHCGYQMVFPNRIDYYYNTGQIVQQDRQEGLKALLEGTIVEPGLCNKLFHEHLFHNLLHTNIMDFAIKNNEDLLMNYYLFKEANLSVFEDWCPYHYMVRKGSAATSKINKHQLLDPIQVVTILMKETKENEELNHIVFQRLLRLQIKLATMPVKENKILIIQPKKKARKFVKKHLVKSLQQRKIDKKLKIMMLWVAVWPWSFEKVHQLYAHITGIDRKYFVE